MQRNAAGDVKVMMKNCHRVVVSARMGDSFRLFLAWTAGVTSIL
jgi:hypothetical protein